MKKTIGVLCLQGGYDSHLRMLKRLRVRALRVTVPEDLEKIDGLIIPGGESTTIGKLLVFHQLFEPLQRKISRDFPVFGTCAGMILLSAGVEGPPQILLGGMDFRVKRNAYGRQIESFDARIPVDGIHEGKCVQGIFIRAPQIRELGKDIVVLGNFEDLPVLVRQGNLLASSFHPELTEDATIHRYFTEIVQTA